MKHYRLICLTVVIGFLLAQPLFSEETKDKDYADLLNRRDLLAQKIVTYLETEKCQAGKKVRVGIEPFEGNVKIKPLEGAEQELGAGIAELLLPGFKKYAKCLDIVEKRSMQGIIDVHKAVLGGPVDTEDNPPKPGKIHAPNFLINGSVTVIKDTVNVTARVVDVETSEILKTFEEAWPKNSFFVWVKPQNQKLRALGYSLLFPGLGQIRINDEPRKGTFFLSSAAGSLLASLVFLLSARYHREQYRSETNPDRIQQFYDDYRREFLLSDIFGITAAAIWTYSAVDAYVCGDNSRIAPQVIMPPVAGHGSPGAMLRYSWKF
jgi:TolB-like protein